MAQANLFCDQCGHEAIVFTLQPPFKATACQAHQSSLADKCPSLFPIAAYDFVEREEDYAEYVGRQETGKTGRVFLTMLSERCDANRIEAFNHLQTLKDALLAAVERSVYELQAQVDQRCQRIKNELNALSIELEKYQSDKHFAWNSSLETLNNTNPAGTLFRVCHGDCSLQIAKIVIGSCVLLPSNSSIPHLNIGENILEIAKNMENQADLAGDISAYAREIGYEDHKIDFQAAVLTKKRKTAKRLLLALPLTTTEVQITDVVRQYWQVAIAGRKEGNYTIYLNKLKRGRGLLQQWGMESPALCLELGMAFAYFGRREEACDVLSQGLQRSRSSDLYLKLSRSLVEVYYQAGQWGNAVKAAELALKSVQNYQDTFEYFQIIYFLVFSCYNLGNREQGFTKIADWTGQAVANNPSSKALLQLINAEKKNQEGSKEEAAELYEKGLEALESSYEGTYITVIARHCLGCIYEDINQQEKERNSFLKAVEVFSAHFPQTLQFAICLGSLADLYESTGKTNEAETHYSRAVAICFAHFPQHLSYAICLYNLGLLLKNAGRKNEAMQRIKEAHKVYTSNGLQLEATACLARLQELRK